MPKLRPRPKHEGLFASIFRYGEWTPGDKSQVRNKCVADHGGRHSLLYFTRILCCCCRCSTTTRTTSGPPRESRRARPEEARARYSVVLVAGTPDGRIIVHDWICILLPCSKQRATNAHPVPIRDVRPTTPGPPNTLKVRATQTTEVEVRPSL